MLRKAFALLVVLTPAVLLWAQAAARPRDDAPAPAAAPAGGRTVYFGTGLSDEDAIVLTSAVAAADPWALVLFDGPKAGKAAAPFLAALKPKAVIPAGPGAFAVDELAERLGTKPATPLAWKAGRPEPLWKALFSRARAVVVAPAEPRRLLLHAACLAGALRAPLYVTHGGDGEPADLR